MTVIVVGEISVAPEKMDEFLAEVERMEGVTRKEDGCISYAMAIDDYKAGKIAVVERWRDEQALRTHLATTNVQNFVSEFGPMILAMEGTLYDASNPRPVL